MGQIDASIQHLATPTLAAGEGILGVGAEAFDLHDIATHSAARVGDQAASYQTRAVLHALAAVGLAGAAVFVGRWSWRNIQPASSPRPVTPPERRA